MSDRDDAAWDTLIGSTQPDRIALVIRHAERRVISDFATGSSVGLTASGRAAAMRLGSKLAPLAPWTIAHSPVARCVETALLLAEGIRRDKGELEMLGALQWLNDPYFLNPEAAYRLAAELGPFRYWRRWLSGQLSSDVAKDPTEAATQQLRAVLDLLRSSTARRYLLVTHDWNLLLVREGVRGLGHRQKGWVDWLDGYTAEPVEGGLRVRYAGCAYDVELAQP